MITEDYVSFETAKLLKEKGFDWECFQYWHEIDNELVHSQSMHPVQNISNPCFFGPAAPTLQTATKWIQETHNIIIIPNYEYECDDTPWCYKIFMLEENGKPQRVAIKGVSYDKDNNPTEHIVGYRDYERSYKDYSTKEEAIEDGIRYCLEKLI